MTGRTSDWWLASSNIQSLEKRLTFSFAAIRHADGRVTGRFQQHQPFFGFTYQGDVTCFAVDPANHRAWIVGVLTQSNDPDPVTEVGDDAWFSVPAPYRGRQLRAGPQHVHGIRAATARQGPQSTRWWRCHHRQG